MGETRVLHPPLSLTTNMSAPSYTRSPLSAAPSPYDVYRSVTKLVTVLAAHITQADRMDKHWLRVVAGEVATHIGNLTKGEQEDKEAAMVRFYSYLHLHKRNTASPPHLRTAVIETTEILLAAIRYHENPAFTCTKCHQVRAKYDVQLLGEDLKLCSLDCHGETGSSDWKIEFPFPIVYVKESMGQETVRAEATISRI